MFYGKSGNNYIYKQMKSYINIIDNGFGQYGVYFRVCPKLSEIHHVPGSKYSIPFDGPGNKTIFVNKVIFKLSEEKRRWPANSNSSDIFIRRQLNNLKE